MPKTGMGLSETVVDFYFVQMIQYSLGGTREAANKAFGIQSAVYLFEVENYRFNKPACVFCG